MTMCTRFMHQSMLPKHQEQMPEQSGSTAFAMTSFAQEFSNSSVSFLIAVASYLVLLPYILRVVVTIIISLV